MEYKFIDLEAATQVGRLHQKSVQPPNLITMRNFMISRSDGNITLRPDFDQYSTSIPTLLGDFVFGTGDDDEDYIQAVTGAFGTDALLWVTRFFLYQIYDWETPTVWNGYTETGTFTLSSGSTSVTGSSTYFLYDASNLEDNVWGGCVLWVPALNEYYIIEDIVDNTTLTLTAAASGSVTAGSCRIYKTHSVDHAGYKPHIENYWGGMIYNNPTNGSFNPENCHGPFVSEASQDTEKDLAWTANTAEDASGLQGNRSGTDYNDFRYGKLFAQADGNGTMLFVSGQGERVWVCANASLPYDASNWSNYAHPATGNPTDGSQSVDYDSTNDKFLIVTSSTQPVEDPDAHTIYFNYSATGLDASWTEKTITVASITGNLSYRNPRSIVTNQTGANPTIIIYERAADGGSTSVRTYKTTDWGDNWTEADTATGATADKYGVSAIWDGTKFVILGEGGNVLWSTDGLTSFTALSISPTNGEICSDILYDGQFYYVANRDTLWVTTDSQTAFTEYSMPTGYGAQRLFQPSGSTRVYITGDAGELAWTDNGGVTITGVDLTTFDDWADGAVVSGIGRYDNKIVLFSPGDEYGNYTKDANVLGYIPDPATWWIFPNYFLPVSTSYRCASWAVIGVYLVLFSTREWDSDNSEWVFRPRRVRWSKPGDVDNFTDDNAGFADLEGSGVILDARTVNNRAVLFETNNVGVFSARGVIDDPFEYEVIAHGVRNLSNPVVVRDQCYFIAQDGLLWQTDGVTCQETGSAFDITKYDDFDESKPIWLNYSAKTDSLYAFQKDETLATHTIYQINISSGSVSEHTVADKTSSNKNMLSTVCIDQAGSSDVLIGFTEDPANEDLLLIGKASFGSAVTGYDDVTDTASSGDYWYGLIETGEMYLAGEGGKTNIVRINIATYCDSGTDSDYNPRVGVEVKGLKDAAWSSRGDTFGTITVSTTACTGTSTAWSNRIAEAGVEVDGATKVFTAPATPRRVYLETGGTYTLQVEDSDYTVSGKVITFAANVNSAYSVYVYWDSDYPETGKVNVGDFIKTTEGLHRVTDVDTATRLTLDHYLSTGSDATATHIPTEQMPDGDGEIQLGVHKLVEGVKVRVYVMPDSSSDATVSKILGMTIVHQPAGKRLEEATGG